QLKFSVELIGLVAPVAILLIDAAGVLLQVAAKRAGSGWIKRGKAGQGDQHRARPSHSAACISRVRSSSCRARRYSTGITLRNLGRYSFHLSRISAARADPVELPWLAMSWCSPSASDLVMALITATPARGSGSP